MSDKPVDADVLRQYLADTKPDPSELRDLLVRHYTDLGAVKVLCKHADGVVPLQAAVFAAHEHFGRFVDPPVELQAVCTFEQCLASWCQKQFRGVTSPELQEFLRTARDAFPDEHEDLFSTIACWLIEHVPLPVLTDEVVAEMSLWEGLCPSRKLGAGGPPVTGDPDDIGSWLLSRHLCNRFGEHGPSWDVFTKLHDPQTLSTGETADQVEELRNRFGEHGPSWKVLLKLNDSQGLSISEAADKVAELRNQFDTQPGSWTVFMGIYDGSQTVADIDAIAKLAVELESPTS